MSGCCKVNVKLWRLGAILGKSPNVSPFAAGTAMILRPSWVQQPQFFLLVSASYGLLSGIFAARALHALRISKKTSALP